MLKNSKTLSFAITFAPLCGNMWTQMLLCCCYAMCDDIRITYQDNIPNLCKHYCVYLTEGKNV